MGRSKHRHLLQDPEVRRWYNNVARGSVVTAEERLRRLGRFCALVGHTPKSLVEMKRKDPEAFEAFIMDFVDSSIAKGEKPAQVANNLKMLKSWLAHFGLRLERKIKLPTIDYVEEVVPSKEQLGAILRQCSARARVTASLMAFSGLRPESIGNYLGTDGLRLRDLPELRLEGGRVAFEKIPAMVVVRRSLSKARHQYFTFLPSEGCGYLKEYLEMRMREGEDLSPDSALVGHLRPGRLQFLRTTKLCWEVKLAIKRAGFSWRPYVLRSYCDTAFDIAESKGLISHPWRQFFMGHKGDIEARYSTNKGRLPPDMVEEMREAYRRCQAYLQTTEAEGPSEERLKEALKRQLLLVAGFKEEEIDRMDLASMGEEEFREAVRKKLLEAMANNGARHKVVATGEIEAYLAEGWEFVAALPDGRAILRIPF